jgi:site-specific recombinase XerD
MLNTIKNNQNKRNPDAKLSGKQQAFIDHLQQEEKQSPKSIEEHIKNLGYFTSWATAQGMAGVEHVSYTELLGYVQYEKERGLKVRSVSLRLNSINKYYEYLKHIGLLDKNPTKKIRLKGELKTITQNVLAYSELEQLYSSYIKLKPEVKNNPTTPYVKQKYNVLAGLMIWQGAISSEIAKITLEHINLEEGSIYIPKRGRSASRELKLLPSQALQIYQYINEARPKLKTIGNELINGYVIDQCCTVIKQLAGINQKVRSNAQLRASIIIHWIKVHGKRKAQYMAGHKYINSTERFELQELDSLKDALMKHHPFN